MRTADAVGVGEVPPLVPEPHAFSRAGTLEPGNPARKRAGPRRPEAAHWPPRAPPPAPPGPRPRPEPTAGAGRTPPPDPAARGRTCRSTVLGVTFTVWRLPFGASTDTAEPPPPAGAAIFRSRDPPPPARLQTTLSAGARTHSHAAVGAGPARASGPARPRPSGAGHAPAPGARPRPRPGRAPDAAAGPGERGLTPRRARWPRASACWPLAPRPRPRKRRAARAASAPRPGLPAPSRPARPGPVGPAIQAPPPQRPPPPPLPLLAHLPRFVPVVTSAVAWCEGQRMAEGKVFRPRRADSATVSDPIS